MCLPHGLEMRKDRSVPSSLMFADCDSMNNNDEMGRTSSDDLYSSLGGGLKPCESHCYMLSLTMATPRC